MTSPAKVRIVVIGCHRFKDAMMHDADLFEPWKRLIEPPVPIDATLAEGESLATVIPRVRQVIEEPGEYRVLAVFNPRVEEGAWCDQTTVMVSTGHQFCRFRDYLEQLGYLGPLPPKYPPREICHEA